MNDLGINSRTMRERLVWDNYVSWARAVFIEAIFLALVLDKHGIIIIQLTHVNEDNLSIPFLKCTPVRLLVEIIMDQLTHICT